ncbi:MAG TPA: efflux RND transporter periplasmic adaptor subunit [Polyangiaceae bacterium]|nr:efflux RND transporter periplasmic adaptor subunit [Polyangiaceae bacterium]
MPPLRPLALAALAALPACKRAEPPPKRPVAVRVEALAPSSPESLTPYGGTVLAQTQVELSFKVGGYVKGIGRAPGGKGARLLQPGDAVEKGEVLATLREDDFRNKLSELSGLRSDAASVYARAKLEYERAEGLFAQGAISKAEFDSVKARYGSAAGAAAAAGARVSEASLVLSDAKLRSPIDGIVLSRGVEVGALVAPGAPVFVIADTRTVRVLFGVPDVVRQGLALERPVAVTSDAIPGRVFAGTVTKIAAQADARTRAFDVEATVDNADGALKVGMVAQAVLGASGEGPGASLLVPLSAVVRPPGAASGFAVFVAAPEAGADVARLRRVGLGELASNRVAVTEGIGPGERVIVQGATLVGDGQRVNVIP